MIPVSPAAPLAADAALMVTDNGGRSWRGFVGGAQNTCVTDLYYDTSDPQGRETLYATHLDAGLLASPRGSGSWTQVLPSSERERGMVAGHYWRIFRAGSGSRSYFYLALKPWTSNRNLVLRSRDTRQWEIIFDEPISKGGRGLGQMTMAVHPLDPARLYLVQDNGEVMLSTNNGDSWTKTKGQPQAQWFNDMVIDREGRLFLATHLSGLWRSTDDGRTWRRLLTKLERVNALATAPGGVFAAASDGNLYRTRDGGDNWERVTDFPPGRDADGSGQEAFAVAVNPRNPNHVILGRADIWHYADLGEGVYESLDGGASWSLQSERLGVPRVGPIEFDPRGRVFAGTYCGGIWSRAAPGTAP